MYLRKLFAALFLLFALDVSAASMRCGNRVVKSNDSRETVLQRCGHPDQKNRGRRMIPVDGVLSLQQVEQWTYRRGPRKHTRIIVFYRGRLHEVVLDKRG